MVPLLSRRFNCTLIFINRKRLLPQLRFNWNVFSWTIKTELLVFILNDTFCSLIKWQQRPFFFLFKLKLSNSKKDVSRLLYWTPIKFSFCFCVLACCGFFCGTMALNHKICKLLGVHWNYIPIFSFKTKNVNRGPIGPRFSFLFWTEIEGYNFSVPRVAYKSYDSMPLCHKKKTPTTRKDTKTKGKFIRRTIK